MNAPSLENFSDCDQLVLIGDTSIGTTAVARRYVDNVFEDSHIHRYGLPCQNGSSAPANVELILIGNKCDLEHHRMVVRDVGVALAMNLGVLFFEGSNKTS